MPFCSIWSMTEMREIFQIWAYLKWLLEYAIMATAKKDIVPWVHKVKAPEVTLWGFL